MQSSALASLWDREVPSARIASMLESAAQEAARWKGLMSVPAPDELRRAATPFLTLCLDVERAVVAAPWLNRWVMLDLRWFALRASVDLAWSRDCAALITDAGFAQCLRAARDARRQVLQVTPGLLSDLLSRLDGARA